jgi:hypothetical protein
MIEGNQITAKNSLQELLLQVMLVAWPSTVWSRVCIFYSMRCSNNREQYMMSTCAPGTSINRTYTLFKYSY